MIRKLPFLLLIFSSSILLLAGGTYRDIHTGRVMNVGDEPSVGLADPWACFGYLLIDAIKNGDHDEFILVLKEASAPRRAYGPLFTSSSLIDLIFHHRLGDGSRIIDLVQQGPNEEIKKTCKTLEESGEILT